MTTAAEESQDTPDASLADTQEDQDKEDTAAAGKKKKGKQKKQPKAKLPIFTGLPPALVQPRDASFFIKRYM